MDDKLTGYIGIYEVVDSNQYRSTVYNKYTRKRVEIGIFDSLEEAIKARNKSELDLGYRNNTVTYFGYTKDDLENSFYYDEYTGLLHWKAKYDSDGNITNEKYIGEPITYKSDNGFFVARIPFNGVRRFARCHRIIWLMHFGELPEHIYHLNEDKEDNRLENLISNDIASNFQSGVDLSGFVKDENVRDFNITIKGSEHSGFIRYGDDEVFLIK